MLKDHYSRDLTPELAGQEVTLAGFVHTRREHGKVTFIDLRDTTGLTQIVFGPDEKRAYKVAKKLSSETIVQITGIVKKRPKGMVNKKVVSGEVELEGKEITILSKAKTAPFEVDKDTKKVSEDKRLKSRYIDLRSKRMTENLKLRHKVVKYLRNFLDNQDFTEIETPYLTKGTPEGAREYVVPSRLHTGKFYVLPQSPQQFKQLLMVGGVEKYYQLARCFRDEDPRADRQQEFTQLDIEMAYLGEEDIINLVEEMFSEMIEDVFPNKEITQLPFPRMTHNEAMKKYQTDSPDMRENQNNPRELGFCWITDFPLMEWDGKGEDLQSTHHPFTKPNEEDLDKLEDAPGQVRAQAYDLVLNGYEIAGGSIRINDHVLQNKIFEILGLSESEIGKKFGHMLEAFEYGVPPHGGIASGIDRVVAILAGEKNIREVIPFPKTGDGRDLMMEAPGKIKKEQLEELNLKIEEKD